MSHKCAVCEGRTNLHALRLVGSQRNASAAGGRGRVWLCDVCIAEVEFFCEAHKRFRVTVSDQEFDEEAGEVRSTLLGVCPDCVTDELNALSRADIQLHIAILMKHMEALCDDIAADRRFGIVRESTFERQLLYNLLCTAQLDGKTLAESIQSQVLSAVALQAEKESDEPADKKPVDEEEEESPSPPKILYS